MSHIAIRSAAGCTSPLKTCVILVTDEPPSTEQLEGISGEGIEDLKTSLAASMFTQALVVVTGMDRNAEVEILEEGFDT